MNKLTQRLLTFFVVVPILIFLIYWDVFHHLPLIILTLAVSGLGAVESGAIIHHKGFPVNRYLAPLLGISFPLMGYLEVLGVINESHVIFGFALLISLVFVRQIFTNQDDVIKTVLHKVTGNLFILIYPGLFLYFFVKMGEFSGASHVFLIFCFLTFSNDSFAWLFGTLFGKNSPKPIVVSPNKSLIGFLGGLLASVSVMVAAYFIFPEILGQSLWLNVLIGVLLGFTTIIGDLFESSIKRSAGTKDSGTLIPGRGGILDSIDSLLFTAPLFYAFLSFFHH